MAVNYARPLPVDRMGHVMVNVPPAASTFGSTHRENTSNSSVTSLSDNTSVVEVTAVGAGAAIRWATNQATSVVTAQGTANFDNVIAAGATRLFVVPRRVAAVPSISGINSQEGLFSGIATKTIAGAGSVLLAEY